VTNAATPPPEAPATSHKPVRKWRGFLKEYAVIVIGVLTALAAQQAAEWWHWQGEVEIAREALRAEMAATNRFYAMRIGFAPCAEQQEREASASLGSLERRDKPAGFLVFHHGLGTLLSDSEWQSQRASQVLTHFPRAELALMNRYYAQFPLTVGWLQEEGAAWSELSILQNPPTGLSPDGIARLRGQLDRTHRLEFLIRLSAYRMLTLGDRLGVARPQVPRSRVKGFCEIGDDKSEAGFLKAAAQP
jgi:hypothetical protein